MPEEAPVMRTVVDGSGAGRLMPASFHPGAITTQLPQGAAQLVAHVQALNPSACASGPDGVPITLPLEAVRTISSDAFSPAAAALVLARSNRGLVRFGNEARPAPVPMSSGVSSIHSAVAC